jgi:hypothetical protein
MTVHLVLVFITAVFYWYLFLFCYVLARN